MTIVTGAVKTHETLADKVAHIQREVTDAVATAEIIQKHLLGKELEGSGVVVGDVAKPPVGATHKLDISLDKMRKLNTLLKELEKEVTPVARIDVARIAADQIITGTRI